LEYHFCHPEELFFDSQNISGHNTDHGETTIACKWGQTDSERIWTGKGVLKLSRTLEEPEE
jgi:hypothetical protein